MNHYVTYSAQAKMLRLINSGGAVGMNILFPADGGTVMEMIDDPTDFANVVISSCPRISTDIHTLRSLQKSSIDFDYATSDFVISK